MAEGLVIILANKPMQFFGSRNFFITIVNFNKTRWGCFIFDADDILKKIDVPQPPQKTSCKSLCRRNITYSSPTPDTDKCTCGIGCSMKAKIICHLGDISYKRALIPL